MSLPTPPSVPPPPLACECKACQGAVSISLIIILILVLFVCCGITMLLRMRMRRAEAAAAIKAADMRAEQRVKDALETVKDLTFPCMLLKVHDFLALGELTSFEVRLACLSRTGTTSQCRRASAARLAHTGTPQPRPRATPSLTHCRRCVDYMSMWIQCTSSPSQRRSASSSSHSAPGRPHRDDPSVSHPRSRSAPPCRARCSQWTSHDHPDHTGRQYRVMCAALSRIIAQEEWLVSDVRVWVDFSSTPQRNKHTQRLAVRTFVSYAACAHAFVIVAPPVLHRDTGKLCNVQTYNGRMW